MAPKRAMGRPAAVVRAVAKPKAKAKARGRAKARPGRGLGRMAMRRPAAKDADTTGKPEGHFRRLSTVEAAAFGKMGYIWLKDAVYYGRAIDVVASVKGFRLEEGQMVLEVKVHGTKSEEFLREMSGRPSRTATVHVCDLTCPETVTGAAYLHGKLYKPVDISGEAWFSNLQQVEGVVAGEDELAALREEARKREGEEDPPREKAKEKKKKKDKSRERKAPKERKEEVSPASSSLEVGQRALAGVFGDTGLDPDPGQRKVWMKKARKLGKSKKKKKKKKKKSDSGEESSYSSGSASSSTTIVTGGGLFETEGKLKAIWMRYPGTLSAAAVGEARQSLMTTSGTIWDVSKEHLPPLMTQYGRMNILPGMSPAMAQEALSLCVGIDMLLQGKVAASCDLLCQRLKSLEAIGRGSHWQMARQLELVRLDNHGITNEEEALGAARRAREENRLKAFTMKPPSSGGGDFGYGGNGQGKGKKKDAKSFGKGRSDDPSKGRNENNNRRDDRQRWQKKDQKDG